MVGGCTICDFEARLDNDEECRSTLFTTEAAENAIWSDPLKVASTADCFHKKEEANRVEKGVRERERGAQSSSVSASVEAQSELVRKRGQKNLGGIRARMAGSSVVNNNLMTFSTDKNSRNARTGKGPGFV